jgi:hypothetical protein
VSPRPKPKAPRTPPNSSSGNRTTSPTTPARYGGSTAPKASTCCPGTRCAPTGRCRRCAGTHTRAAHLGAEGVRYAAANVATSLAEVYQTTRVIDTRAGAATLTAWQPQRRLRLLDLSGTWLLRNTASAALLAAPRSICRRWARAIHTTWPELDGLYVPSTLTGRPNIHKPARNNFRAHPCRRTESPT